MKLENGKKKQVPRCACRGRRARDDRSRETKRAKGRAEARPLQRAQRARCIVPLQGGKARMLGYPIEDKRDSSLRSVLQDHRGCKQRE